MIIKLMGKPNEVAANVHFFTKLFGKKTTINEVISIFKVASNEGN